MSGADISVTPPGELTSSVYLAGTQLRIITVVTDGGAVSSVDDTGANARPFRCVAYPSN